MLNVYHLRGLTNRVKNKCGLKGERVPSMPALSDFIRFMSKPGAFRTEGDLVHVGILAVIENVVVELFTQEELFFLENPWGRWRSGCNCPR